MGIDARCSCCQDSAKALVRVPVRWSLGLLLTAVVVGSVPFAGCGSSPAPTPKEKPKAEAPAPPPPPPAPPPPAPMAIGALNAVTLEPGKTATVRLPVTRGSATGAIQIQTAGAPQGITVTAKEIPADKSEGQLELAASEKLGDQDLKATIKITAKAGTVQAEKELPVVVSKLKLPSFQAAKPILLQPGGSMAVDLAINRNGYEGPLELRVENLPAGVTGVVSKLEAKQATTNLQVTVGSDAPDARQPVRVATTLYGRTISVDVPLQINRTPFRVKAFQVVNLKPGETKRIEVPVERSSYQGPLEIEPSSLPEGVSIKKVTVAPDKKTVALEIVAAENAKERVRSAKLVSKGGNLSRTDPMVIRVTRNERGFLPKELTANPEMMPLLRRGSFGGRLTVASKKALLDAYGGSPESEAAVMRALRWLATHQQADGRWKLKEYGKDIQGCDCRDEKFEDKVLETDIAATAFGVLPFLGAGVGLDRCPEDPPELAGEYMKRVKSAIGFLVKSQSHNPKDPLVDGRLDSHMYAHAVATIALCEAYGLATEEFQDRLRVPAQKAIKYIAQTQHKEGGWRYGPRQPGDMSAVAWQFLAIRSGQLAGMIIDRSPLIRAERFVDSCGAGPENAKMSRYCYQPGGQATLSLTGAGLLTREYLGWHRDNPDLAAGCKYLMENLPPESGSSLGPIYYYYYATQVLHHMEGSDFDLWNYRMREHLIRTQEKEGHKAGSWNPQGVDYGHAGGRLYATSMAAMTLQVYYRHLPMFRPAVRGTRAEAAEEK